MSSSKNCRKSCASMVGGQSGWAAVRRSMIMLTVLDPVQSRMIWLAEPFKMRPRSGESNRYSPEIRSNRSRAFLVNAGRLC
jgi:hypothetical protein